MRLNGTPPTADDLTALALYGYGHYTTMRVEPAGVRGLSRHLRRLSEDSERLFGTRVTPHRVLELVTDYLAGRPRPTIVRVTVFGRDFRLGEPDRTKPSDILVSSRPVPEEPAPLRLRTTEHRRELAEVKHVGLLPELYARAAGRRDGADDALFVTAGGLLSEGATWNLGFYRDGAVVWPDQPQLTGVTKQLLSDAALAMGLTVTHRPVSAGELAPFPVAFICNAALGVVPIASIDGHPFQPGGLDDLRTAYASVPLESL